jgi:alcohol dehydrogenase
VLDPELALSQPAAVRSVTGYDALSHAVETWVTTRRNPMSRMLSREAWRLLNANFERTLTKLDDIEAIAGMQLGAFFAGSAIEHSMLGATHACANPVTARYGTVHGAAIAGLLTHVVRWNGGDLYAELHRDAAARVEDLARAAGLAARLRPLGVVEAELGALAEEAALQWTGRFNPRPFDAAAAAEVYQCAY